MPQASKHASGDGEANSPSPEPGEHHGLGARLRDYRTGKREAGDLAIDHAVNVLDANLPAVGLD